MNAMRQRLGNFVFACHAVASVLRAIVLAMVFRPTNAGEAKSFVTERYRYSRYAKPRNEMYPGELYDHQNDPGEHHNLRLDEQYDGLMKELSALLNGGWKGALPDDIN